MGTATVGRARVTGTTAALHVTCTGAPGAHCKLSLGMTVTETLRGHRVIGVAPRLRHTVVGVGSAAGDAHRGGMQGRAGLAERRVGSCWRRAMLLKVNLVVTEALGNGRSATVSKQIVTFKKHRHGRH